MRTITHAPRQADPIFTAISAHRAAFDAYQRAPEGKASLIANDDYDAASAALIASPCSTRFGALALLEHLHWWLGIEAPFRGGHEPAYTIAEARAADLSLFLGTPLAPALPGSDPAAVLASLLPPAAPSGRLGRVPLLLGRAVEALSVLGLLAGGAVLTGFASLL